MSFLSPFFVFLFFLCGCSRIGACSGGSMFGCTRASLTGVFRRPARLVARAAADSDPDWVCRDGGQKHTREEKHTVDGSHFQFRFAAVAVDTAQTYASVACLSPASQIFYEQFSNSPKIHQSSI
jgi:hypothetical protein